MTKKQRIVSGVVLGIYTVLLSWLVLLKLSPDINSIMEMHSRSLNLIPFAESAVVNGKVNVMEIMMNVVVFIPLGVYVQLFNPKRSIWYRIFPAFLLSLTYECIQYAFAIGASDITDLLMNTLGGMIGIALCVLFLRLFNRMYVAVINGVGILVEAGAFSMIALLTGN